MTKGNPSKRVGTSTELQLLRKLRQADPDGQWESRTQDLDGKRKDTAPDGWDVFSRKRYTWIECKLRAKRVTWHEIRDWCIAAIGRDCPRPTANTPVRLVMFRHKHSSEWTVVDPWQSARQGLLLSSEPFDQWATVMQHRGR